MQTFQIQKNIVDNTLSNRLLSNALKHEFLCFSDKSLSAAATLPSASAAASQRRTVLPGLAELADYRPKFLSRPTSSTTMALARSNSSWPLPRTRRTKGSRWTGWGFAKTCSGWKAVASLHFTVCALPFLVVWLLGKLGWEKVKVFAQLVDIWMSFFVLFFEIWRNWQFLLVVSLRNLCL